MQITAKELSELLNGTVEGNPDVIVSQPAKIEEARSHEVSFIANPKYEQYAATTQAGVLIVSKDFTANGGVNATLIRVDDPYQSLSQLLAHFQQNVRSKVGIEQPCFVAESATVADDTYVGAFSYIGENAVISSGAKIYPNSYIGDGATVGANTIIHAGVKIYVGCRVGDNCVIHSGTVIGSDGFGFVPNAQGGFDKVPQTGNVVIEDNVEIGANCCIDRGTMGSTLIKKGVKLDNQIQVAHNVEIDEHTVIAAQTGISGSTKIGKYCMIGGQVGFVGHLTIADGSKINAKSGLSKSIKEPNKAWNGRPVIDYHKSLKSQAIFRNLPELEKRVRELEALLREKDKE